MCDLSSYYLNIAKVEIYPFQSPHIMRKIISFRGNYIFPHELSAIVNMPPQIDTSTKKKHATTIKKTQIP
jgi:hypothetical protein